MGEGKKGKDFLFYRMNANFKGANMSLCNLINATFDGSDMRFVDLRNAKEETVSMQCVNLMYAKAFGWPNVKF